jgi:hypothetical protein
MNERESAASRRPVSRIRPRIRPERPRSPLATRRTWAMALQPSNHPPKHSWSRPGIRRKRRPMPGARSNRPAAPARCGSPRSAQRARPPAPKVPSGLALLRRRARRHSANHAQPRRSSSSLPAPVRTAIAQSSEFPKNPGIHANKPPASRHTGLPKGHEAPADGLWPFSPNDRWSDGSWHQP